MQALLGRLGIILIGALIAGAGIFNWEWAFKQRGVLQRILPRPVLRGIYVLLGGALAVYGALAGFVLPT